MSILDIDDSYSAFQDGRTDEAIEILPKEIRDFSEFDEYPVFREIEYELTNERIKPLEVIYKEIEEICINNSISCSALGIE